MTAVDCVHGIEEGAIGYWESDLDGESELLAAITDTGMFDSVSITDDALAIPQVVKAFGQIENPKFTVVAKGNDGTVTLRDSPPGAEPSEMGRLNLEVEEGLPSVTTVSWKEEPRKRN